MDHIPKTSDGKTLQVPFLVPTEYRNYSARGVAVFSQMQITSLADYPAKDPAAEAPTTFIKSFLTKPQPHKISRSEEELLSATQVYLYFVFLVEVFQVAGVTVDITRFFTSNEKGQLVVTTAALTEYVCYWHLKVDSASSSTKEHHLGQISVLFGVASAWLTAWGSRLRLVDPPPSDRYGYTSRKYDCHHLSYPRAQTILLSIRILQETLHMACESAYSSVSITPEGVGLTNAPEHELFRSRYMQTDFEFADQLMVDSGWCPNEIAVLTHRTTGKLNTLKYFLSTMNRTRLGRDHSRCNRQRCYKLMEYPYLPEHVSSGCQCPNVFTCTEERSGDDIVSIIQKGSIPLIRIRPNASDENLLELSAYNPKDDPSSRPIYIAISHVWSDGRGNRTDNSLPACQIRELQNLVSFSHHADNYSGVLDEETFLHMENVYFWIDTLCIPRNHEQEKKHAIKDMFDIYQKASSVVVIDKGILRSDLKTSLQDMLMAVAESNWAKRLWTLQEGRLGSKMRFQFADGVYTIDSREQLLKDRLAEAFLPDMGSRLELASILREIESGEERELAVWLLMSLACLYDNAADLYRSLVPSQAQPMLEDLPASQRLLLRLKTFWQNEPVLSHAANRFGGFLSANDTLSRENSAHRQSLKFLDICDHLQLRRTTEAADEAGSMASLLNADLTSVLNADAKERMAVLLQSLERLPLVLLFFQGERYEEDGRRWIPKSFLLQNGRLGDIWGPLETSALLNQFAQPKPEGLLVSAPGFRLQSPPSSASPEQCYLVHGTVKYVLTLTDGNRLKLGRTNWTNYAHTELAVILPAALDDASQRVSAGILVSRRKEEDGVYYCRFEHTIYMHRAESSTPSYFYSIKIEWPGLTGKELFAPIKILPSTQAWCVG